jgi:hypothetical protein
MLDVNRALARDLSGDLGGDLGIQLLAMSGLRSPRPREVSKAATCNPSAGLALFAPAGRSTADGGFSILEEIVQVAT